VTSADRAGDPSCLTQCEISRLVRARKQVGRAGQDLSQPHSLGSGSGADCFLGGAKSITVSTHMYTRFSRHELQFRRSRERFVGHRERNA
jgi:hypothetical protein